MYNVLDANGVGDMSTESQDSSETDNVPDETLLVSDTPSETGLKEDPKKILYPIHTVTPKQTLEAISRQYNVSVEALKNTNPGLTDDLKIDQKVIIPTIKGVEYVVKKGDVLSVIAAKYGIDNLYHILVANNMTSASKIRIGQKLLLPNPTKDPNPKKKPQETPLPVAKKSSNVPNKTPVKTTSTPKTLTYGTYSLSLKVEK